jgi:adenylate kinase
MIIVTGVAGSGKSTQCQMLVRSGDFQWLSVGELLRASEDQRVHDVVNSGSIINDDITIPLVEAEILRRGASPEILIDGFPRSKTQADWLLSMHNTDQPEFIIRGIVHITLSEELALERLHKRGRGDDYDAAIAKRFEVYEDVVLPIISTFDREGIPVIEVDGSDTPEGVHAKVMSEIDKL